jgi:toxin ParE1/3/4
MPRIVRTRQARKDLREILSYLGGHNRMVAERFAEEIQAKSQILSQFPEMGRSREELAHRLRSFPVGKYILFYRPVKDGIAIIRVLHGARDIPSLFDD